MSLFSLYEWCMVLFPILNIYLTPIQGISIGEVIILVFGLYIIIKKGVLEFDKRVVIFYSYMFLVTAIIALLTFSQIGQNGLTKLLSYILYSILLLIYFNVGRIETFCAKYLVVARIICILTLLQFVLLQFGVRIPLIIPGIKNVAGRSFAQLLNFHSMSGPFTEPAHFAQYVSVALILALLKKKVNRRDVVLFVLSMLLTFKGTAVTQLVAIFGVISYRYLRSQDKKKIFKVLSIGVCSVVAVVILYSTVDAFKIMFSRVYEIVGAGDRSLTGYHGVSGYFRVKYGFDFFQSLDWFHKIFGIGITSFGQYDALSVVPEAIRYLEETNALQDFRSGITLILTDGGLIGIVLYLYAVFKKRSDAQRLFAFSLIVLQFVAGDMNVPSWLILMFLTFKYSDKVLYESEEKLI